MRQDVQRVSRKNMTPEERRIHKNAVSKRWGELNRDLRLQYKRKSRLKAGLKPRNPGTRKRHGMSPEQIGNIRASQNERCSICKTPLQFTRSCVDHCHKSGNIRGILCRDCNIGLGMFKDNPRFLRAAIKYLKQNDPSFGG